MLAPVFDTGDADRTLDSPSISLRSDSMARHMVVMGTSFAPPSNGFSVLSPTCSSEVYIHDTITLNGTSSHIMLPCRKPLTPSLSLSNSFSKPNGKSTQKNRTKSVLIVAY